MSDLTTQEEKKRKRAEMSERKEVPLSTLVDKANKYKVKMSDLTTQEEKKRKRAEMSERKEEEKQKRKALIEEQKVLLREEKKRTKERTKAEEAAERKVHWEEREALRREECQRLIVKGRALEEEAKRWIAKETAEPTTLSASSSVSLPTTESVASSSDEEATEKVRALVKKILQKKHKQPGGPYNKNKKARKAKGTRYWHGIKYDLLTEEDLKQATAELEAAPKAYADMQIMLQKAKENYQNTGKHIGTDFCIFSTSNHNDTPEILLSSFYFSSKAQSDHLAHLLTTFPRYNGTIILMGAAVRGSYKFYEEGGGYQQPYHGATSGKGWSAVLIGMMVADDCTKAFDKLIKEFVLTQARLIEILEAWDKGAPDSAKINKFFKNQTKLEYQARSIYRSDRDKEGYVKIGLASNLIPQYKKLMKEEISTSFNEDNKVEVYAPELVSLMDISMGSP